VNGHGEGQLVLTQEKRVVEKGEEGRDAENEPD
jgi:hypothetical protein